jgi:hypothetical protein
METAGMPEVQAASETFLIERWKQLRAEMNEVISRGVELERYALLSTGAIWAWLATATDVDWSPAFKWLPFMLNAFFALRALGLGLRTREIASSLAAAETRLSLPLELTPESARGPRGIKMVTAWAFWPLLLAVTLVLPFFYVEHGLDDCGPEQTLTRLTHTAVPAPGRSGWRNHL